MKRRIPSLPYLLNRIGSFYPKLTLEIKVLSYADIVAKLGSGEIDPALTTHQTGEFDVLTLRTSPTLWYCAADYVLAQGESVPLVLLEESGPFREDIISALNAAQVPRHLAHAASSLAGVKAAVKAGLGVTARPVEMMSPELRVPGKSDGLPGLPDTHYVLSCNPQREKRTGAGDFFQSLSRDHNPWNTETLYTPEGETVLWFYKAELSYIDHNNPVTKCKCKKSRRSTKWGQWLFFYILQGFLSSLIIY